MSGYLNKAQLIGNLGADPESRTMQNGGLMVTLSVATSENWRDPASGERRTRTWQDTEGHDRYSTEIHLTPYNGTLTVLDPRKSGEGAPADGSPHDPGNDVSY